MGAPESHYDWLRILEQRVDMLTVGTAGVWTRNAVAGTLYSTTANDDVIPNAGAGTLGLVGDPWDMAFLDDITITGVGTVGISGANLLVHAGTNLQLNGAGSIFLQSVGASRVFVNINGLYPAANNTYPTGLAAVRWSNVYSVLGNFDQANNAAAVPVVTIDQADVSEGFINFIGSDRGVITGATNSVESVRVELGGVVRRLALYADA